ncbi:MAG TPA: ABC transporter ATP-binding protein [bacterium]|jgi:putative spermidine/putrescine transport system ATP-binding protein
MTISLEGVSFRYPHSDAGVFEVNLAVGAGELLAVIGASGSGKTTLLRLIAGFLLPDQGTVRLAGQDVTRLPPRERQVGVVFQNYALFPHMNAADNVAYPLKVRAVPREERRTRALDMLRRVGLAGFERRLPALLSGGQQQRVALARALVFEPRALLLDEPLSALDAALRVEMRDEIRRLQRLHHIATIHITHDQEEALSMADRVAVMERGRLVQVDTPRALYDAPRTRSVAAFVGRANLWEGEVIAGDRVRVGFGELRLRPHGRAHGERVCVLVRPERVAIGQAPDGINAFPCRVERDRFLGATRRFDARIGANEGILEGETGYRGEFDAVHILPEHIQLLPAE